jgi:segregation and condensation protein B
MLQAQLESLLFLSDKPLSVRLLAKRLGATEAAVRAALHSLRKARNRDDSGIHLLEHEGSFQFISNPAHAEMLAQHVREELSGDLTRPQLETLTIICYRGPVTKSEIEHIRGVHCALILRHLLMRGLIDETDDPERMQPTYQVSHAFLRHLGLTHVADLPEYEAFHEQEAITRLLQESPRLASGS